MLNDEEEWINSNVNPTHRSSEDEITEEHPDGGYNDLLLGMIMGFLLGLITLFWVSINVIEHV